MEWTKYMLLKLIIKNRLIEILFSCMSFCILALSSCSISSEQKIKDLQKSFYSSDYKKIEKLLSSDLKLYPSLQNELMRISLEIKKDPKSTLLLTDYFNDADILYKEQTALYWTLKLGDNETAKSLVIKGANLFSCNNDDIDDTPFSLVLNTKNQKFIDWLVKEYLESHDLNSTTVEKVFSGLLNKGYVVSAECLIQNPKNKAKLITCPDVVSLIVYNFYDKKCEHIINELKKSELKFDKDYAYYHMALISDEKDITSVIKWLEKNHVKKNYKYYFTDHPCTVDNEYTSPAEFSALLAHFHSKKISASDTIDSELILKYKKWAEYFEKSSCK
ncbi:MAG: hypothetical protein K6B17_03625 [Treponema sp.]|nr:hypothetical protein [Treponema sp.]